MSDRFTGAWLVSEYVYNADGTFAGVVRQRRRLEPLDDGRVRVLQQCQPDGALDGHPMGAFRGDWVFTLRREGRKRVYEGPDVVGMGQAWGDNTITGRGVWTRFGHNFTSFGVMVTPERQITGGKFYNAAELVANIVGVAVPERADARDAYPTLSGATWAGDVACVWKGTSHSYDTDDLMGIASVTRTYGADGWEDDIASSATGTVFTRRLEVLQGRSRLHTTWRFAGEETPRPSPPGIAKRSGWLLEWAGHTEEDYGFCASILDAQHKTIAELDQGWFDIATYNGLNVTLLTAE